MPLYDSFLETMEKLPPFVKRMERSRQRQVMRWISAELPTEEKTPIHVLEVGVGTGLFARCCCELGWRYTGVDRNPLMVERLAVDFNVVQGECPPLPAVGTRQFDLAYAAFVLEHLPDGEAALRFVEAMKEKVRPDGLVVLLVPDALSLGLEFWNLDYTHRFPTSWRNVMHVMRESGLNDIEMIRYCGPGWRGWRRMVVRVLGKMYWYPLWRCLSGGADWPYSVFQYVQMDMLCFISRV